MSLIPAIFQFNQQALGVPTKDVPYLEPKHADFCVKAIREEAKELEDEHHHLGAPLIKAPGSEEARWQTVKSVDALLDAAYFAIGGLARAGLTLEQAEACFGAVHQANMTKKLGVAESRGDMGVADAVKPADFVPPETAMYEIIYGEKPPTEVQS